MHWAAAMVQLTNGDSHCGPGDSGAYRLTDGDTARIARPATQDLPARTARGSLEAHPGPADPLAVAAHREIGTGRPPDTKNGSGRQTPDGEATSRPDSDPSDRQGVSPSPANRPSRRRISR